MLTNVTVFLSLPLKESISWDQSAFTLWPSGKLKFTKHGLYFYEISVVVLILTPPVKDRWTVCFSIDKDFPWRHQCKNKKGLQALSLWWPEKQDWLCVVPTSEKKTHPFKNPEDWSPDLLFTFKFFLNSLQSIRMLLQEYLDRASHSFIALGPRWSGKSTLY